MAELVDALDSKSNSSNTVRVRFSLCPPKTMNIKNINNLNQLFFEKYLSLKNKNEILLTNLKEPKKSYSC